MFVALWRLSGIFTAGVIGAIGAAATGGFVLSILCHRQNLDNDRQLSHWVRHVTARLAVGVPAEAALVDASHCRADAVRHLAMDIKQGVGLKRAIRAFDRRAKSSVVDGLVVSILTGTENLSLGQHRDRIPTTLYTEATLGALTAGVSAVTMIVFSFIAGKSGLIGGHPAEELKLGGLAVLWGVLLGGLWWTSRPRFRYPVSEYWNEAGQLTLNRQHATAVRDGGWWYSPVEEFFAYPQRVLWMTRTKRDRSFDRTLLLNSLCLTLVFACLTAYLAVGMSHYFMNPAG